LDLTSVANSVIELIIQQRKLSWRERVFDIIRGNAGVASSDIGYLTNQVYTVKASVAPAIRIG
jgi:hypothetical protein